MRVFVALFLFVCSFTAVGAEGRLNASGKHPLAVRFMSKGEASRTLSEGNARQYYQSLQLLEMRAKTGLPLEGMTLERAREVTREFYVNQTLDFSGNERAAIQAVLEQVQGSLKAKAPVYVNTSWCFIKVSVRIEGGLPHTRGDCVVLSPNVLDVFAQLWTQKRMKELYAATTNMLVHEQTHVLQRRLPSRFASLNERLGYRHITPSPAAGNDWLQAIGVVNPDGMDTGWVYPVKVGDGQRWIMPYLVLRSTARPVMPDHFVMLGVMVTETNGVWKTQNASPDASARELLSGFVLYARHFPNRHQAYHPNEVSADILAAWLTDSNDVDLQHPVSVKTLEWARSNLN